MTNYEKIKSMSVEELTANLSLLFDCAMCPLSDSCKEGDSCRVNIREWLEGEAEEND